MLKYRHCILLCCGSQIIFSKIMLLAYIFVTIILLKCALSRHRHHHHHHNHQHGMHPLSDEFIVSINSQQSLWRAGRNFHRNTPISFIKGLMGTIINESEDYEMFTSESPNCTKLPNNLDARDRWPYCVSMKVIKDQGACGSCWAVSVASVMTDRLCTLTRGVEKISISEQDILTCCSDCLISDMHLCAGGRTYDAWRYSNRNGVVSGGSYRSTGGCKSYQYKPCKHTINYSGKRNKCTPEDFNTKRYCEKSCKSNTEYLIYETDKRIFRTIYTVTDPLCEIYKFGPITAIMNVYDDFINYKSGVYRRSDRKDNRLQGNHTVKILGWGVDEKTKVKYWLGANSWNENWGDHGFFKIVRGENHCNIEKYMTAGKL